MEFGSGSDLGGEVEVEVEVGSGGRSIEVKDSRAPGLRDCTRVVMVAMADVSAERSGVGEWSWRPR